MIKSAGKSFQHLTGWETRYRTLMFDTFHFAFSQGMNI